MALTILIWLLATGHISVLLTQDFNAFLNHDAAGGQPSSFNGLHSHLPAAEVFMEVINVRTHSSHGINMSKNGFLLSFSASSPILFLRGGCGSYGAGIIGSQLFPQLYSLDQLVLISAF